MRTLCTINDVDGGTVRINLEGTSLELRDLFREVIRPLKFWNWESGDFSDWTEVMTVAEFRQTALFADVLAGRTS